jgi:hypothetical protein
MDVTKTNLRKVYNEYIVNEAEDLRELVAVDGYNHHSYLRTRVLEDLRTGVVNLRTLLLLVLRDFPDVKLTRAALSAFYTQEINFDPTDYYPVSLLLNTPDEFIICRLREAVHVGEYLLAFRLALVLRTRYYEEVKLDMAREIVYKEEARRQ